MSALPITRRNPVLSGALAALAAVAVLVGSAATAGAQPVGAPRLGPPETVAGFVESLSMHPDGLTPLLTLHGLPVYLTWPGGRPAGTVQPGSDPVASHLSELARRMVGRAVVIRFRATDDGWRIEEMSEAREDDAAFVAHAVRTPSGDIARGRAPRTPPFPKELAPPLRPR